MDLQVASPRTANLLAAEDTRNSNLDMLRAIAIIAVLIYHAEGMAPVRYTLVSSTTRYGTHGVDLFFVLSGWLIGRLYWKELAVFASVEIPRFLARRWIRTIPPYLVALLLAWTAVHIVRAEPFDWTYLAFLQNYRAAMPFFWVSWSLCVEEHFYVLAPLLLGLALWTGRRSVCLLPLWALTTLSPAALRFVEVNNEPLVSAIC